MNAVSRYRTGLILRKNFRQLGILLIPILFLCAPLLAFFMQTPPEIWLASGAGLVFFVVLMLETKFDIDHFAPKGSVRVIFVNYASEAAEEVEGDYEDVIHARTHVHTAHAQKKTFGCFRIYDEFGTCQETISR